MTQPEIYRINPYLFYNLNDKHAVVQTSFGLTKITDTRMKNFLLDSEKNKIKTATIDLFNNYFNEITYAAIDFLTTYRVIELDIDINIDINSISVYSNHSPSNELIYNTLHSQYKDKLKVNAISEINLEVLDEKTLLIVFLNPYDKNLIKSIQEWQKDNKESISLISYVYSNNFYMDCFYSPKWKLPCHNCHMGHIKSNFYSGESNESTYQQLIDELYIETEDKIGIGSPIDSKSVLNISCEIINVVSNYLSDLERTTFDLEDSNVCTLIDLNNFKRYKDTSIHWEMCDCYE